MISVSAISGAAGTGDSPQCGFQCFTDADPAQTVRATVIGAGAHTLSLSGSTIWLDSITLPVRNIPVVHPALGRADDDEDLVNTGAVP